MKLSTIKKIRDLCGSYGDNDYNIPVHYNNDQYLAVIDVYEILNKKNYCPMWLLVSWYKNRMRTDALYLLDVYGEIKKPTENDLLEIIKFYKQNN